jgi:hypothetical protein
MKTRLDLRNGVCPKNVLDDRSSPAWYKSADGGTIFSHFLQRDTICHYIPKRESSPIKRNEGLTIHECSIT